MGPFSAPSTPVDPCDSVPPPVWKATSRRRGWRSVRARSGMEPLEWDRRTFGRRARTRPGNRMRPMARQAVEFRRLRCQTQRRSGRLIDSRRGAVREAWTDSARHALPDDEIFRSSVHDRERRSAIGPVCRAWMLVSGHGGGLDRDPAGAPPGALRNEVVRSDRVEAEPGRR